MCVRLLRAPGASASQRSPRTPQTKHQAAVHVGIFGVVRTAALRCARVTPTSGASRACVRTGHCGVVLPDPAASRVARGGLPAVQPRCAPHAPDPLCAPLLRFVRLPIACALVVLCTDAQRRAAGNAVLLLLWAFLPTNASVHQLAMVGVSVVEWVLGVGLLLPYVCTYPGAEPAACSARASRPPRRAAPQVLVHRFNRTRPGPDAMVLHSPAISMPGAEEGSFAGSTNELVERMRRCVTPTPPSALPDSRLPSRARSDIGCASDTADFFKQRSEELAREVSALRDQLAEADATFVPTVCHGLGGARCRSCSRAGE